ncbi:NAD-dependent protein lipoamidase sirtuin-4 [Tyrophagus putrescentiae]|nr:NAD-dependent protein lipoamidase sirtuin-4 [Tyrophagus putrescentiae]
MKLKVKSAVRYAFLTSKFSVHNRPLLSAITTANITSSFHLSTAVPKQPESQAAAAVSQGDIAQLQRFFDQHSGDRLLALTGAGISTESGIPDYRSPGVGLYTRTPNDGNGNSSYRPMTASAFLGSAAARQRYWARSFLAWRSTIFGAQPNAGHLSLASWQRAGKLGAIVTQNVDRLHQKAGSEHVLELHGSLYTVRCLRCSRRIARTLMQSRLEELNAGLLLENEKLLKSQQNSQLGLGARPDGDIDLSQAEHFEGILKPDIVFFGENVPRTVVEEIGGLVERCSGLLVLGTSLAVFSSYRFVVQALALQKPLLLVNIGPTRADGQDGVVRLDAKLGDLLPRIEVESRC